jgi:2-methylisocitrate lyase-like PEP mutase family enzyme
MDQKAKADLLRNLHTGRDMLVLVNAWDGVSARLIEAEGFPAVATGSAGVAAVLGYPDGQRVPREEMMFMIRRIAQSVDLPVTADVESGYGDPVSTALEVIKAGAAGMNLEDMASGELFPLNQQIEKIRAIRAAVDAAGIPLVINARTDILLEKHGDSATRFERSLERLNAYYAAGADCLFAPGISDPQTIERMASTVKGPLNILATIGTPSLRDLKRMGVKRVSFGSGPSRVALGALRRIARDIRDNGTFKALETEAVPYADVQKLLARG